MTRYTLGTIYYFLKTTGCSSPPSPLFTCLFRATAIFICVLFIDEDYINCHLALHRIA